MTAIRNLMKFITTPSRLAGNLDWKKTSGSLLAIDIGKDRLGLAVASHPSFDEPVCKLEPMQVQLETRRRNQKVLPKSVVNELQQIVQSYNVCGFVVSWPLQNDGRCGAPCGQTLHFLESLVCESNSIVTTTRPFCLWDDHHYEPDEDQWGRTPRHGYASKKTIHRASEEQYVHECNSTVAADVWNDFCQQHWPDLYEGVDADASASRQASTSC